MNHLIALLTFRHFQIPLVRRTYTVWDFLIEIFARKAILSTLSCQYLHDKYNLKQLYLIVIKRALVWFYTIYRLHLKEYLEASEPKWFNPVLNIIGLTSLGSEASKLRFSWNIWLLRTKSNFTWKYYSWLYFLELSLFIFIYHLNELEVMQILFG